MAGSQVRPCAAPVAKGSANAVTVATSSANVAVRCGAGRAAMSVAQVVAEPPAHVPDGLVHPGYTSCCKDEGVLPFGQGAGLGGDFEVGEPASELGVFSGENLVLAVVETCGRAVR